MSLVLSPKADAADDYHVLHGELQVGQIYKRKAAIRPEAQWLWALNGVPEGPHGLALEHFSKRLNRGIPLRERIGFNVRAGMEASMDGETVFGGSACARRWGGTGWGYHPRNCGATWREYQLCRAFP